MAIHSAIDEKTEESVLIDYWWTYPLLGAVTGLCAGLLGVGGGLVMVPVLSFIFRAEGFPQQYVMHLALGTSIATILFTSISNMLSHHGFGAVRWPIVRALAPGLVFGTLVGAVVVRFLDTRPLSIIFTIFVYYTAARMLSAAPTLSTRGMPGRSGMAGAGAMIGAVSSMVGIGGATLAVPFMLKRNVSMHNAIGTAAAIGFPIAATGTIGYIVTGMSSALLPAHSLGFVYLPALAGLVVASIVTAPLGVRLAHHTKPIHLRRIFTLVLLLLATRMLISLF
jgi:uncharacterized membrane protein YfcA